MTVESWSKVCGYSFSPCACSSTRQGGTSSSSLSSQLWWSLDSTGHELPSSISCCEVSTWNTAWWENTNEWINGCKRKCNYPSNWMYKIHIRYTAWFPTFSTLGTHRVTSNFQQPETPTIHQWLKRWRYRAGVKHWVKLRPSLPNKMEESSAVIMSWWTQSQLDGFQPVKATDKETAPTVCVGGGNVAAGPLFLLQSDLFNLCRYQQTQVTWITADWFAWLQSLRHLPTWCHCCLSQNYTLYCISSS